MGIFCPPDIDMVGNQAVPFEYEPQHILEPVRLPVELRFLN